jgi:hypothetical protein
MMPLNYFDEIKCLKPERIFFIMCNSAARETFIILKFSDWKYKVLRYMWNISDHVGDSGQAQIFSVSIA